MKRFLAALALGLATATTSLAQQPADPQNTLYLDTKDGRGDDPLAPGPGAEACGTDQGADEAGLLRRHRLPPRRVIRRLHGPDRRPDGHRHRQVGPAEHPGRVHVDAL